jgi:type I restriction enzyme M protein
MAANIWGIVKAIQDIMRKDPWVDGDAQRIGQISWLLFLKIYDDKEKEFELMIDGYSSPIPEEYKWRNWAGNDEGITGDELLEFINEKLFKTLKGLTGDSKNPMSYIVKWVFEDSFNYMKSGVLIRQVVNKINQIDFTKKAELHIFNDIYEKVLKDLQSAWNAGEYYTPRAVTQFIVDMTAPILWDKVFDPSCGTGGFLTCAIESIRDMYVRTPQDEAILQGSIYGTELKQLPHLLATTNLILHGVECPINLRHDDSLSRPIKDYEDRDMVDVIVSNPPFWGQVAPWISHNFPAQFQTQETANLFLVLIITLLRYNGRAWVVLPDGFLFWEGIATRIKEKLLSDCNLHTIVRLPKGVFSPYTNISTNLLFFTKWEPTKEIWYFEHPIPEGIKNYSMTKPVRIEEFDLEKSWWNNRVESEYAYKVSIDDIKARNYNLDIKNPHKSEEAEILDTKEIIDAIENNFKQATTILESIKAQI